MIVIVANKYNLTVQSCLGGGGEVQIQCETIPR